MFFFRNADRHKLGFSVVFGAAHVATVVERKSLGREHGSSHGNGKKKMKGRKTILEKEIYQEGCNGL